MQECQLAKCFDGCFHRPVCWADFLHAVIDGITADRQTNDVNKLLN